MNPLITKAIECLPQKKELLSKIDPSPINLAYKNYNQCRQEIIDHSLPLIFKMIQDEIEKAFPEDIWLGDDYHSEEVLRIIKPILTIERPEEIPQMKGTLEALDKLTIEKK